MREKTKCSEHIHKGNLNNVVYVCNECDEVQEDSSSCEQCEGSMRTVDREEII